MDKSSQDKRSSRKTVSDTNACPHRPHTAARLSRILTWFPFNHCPKSRQQTNCGAKVQRKLQMTKFSYGNMKM